MSKPLFIFELANNHMGRLNHGLRIIRELREATRGFDEFRFAVKLQYRDLDTFIHPDFQGRDDVKYVKRFSETRLTEKEFMILKEEMDECGFTAVCTPFDENSVERIERHGYDYLKIASCSVTDWPLLERIARSHLPIIASTAGVPFEDIDKMVSFFEHRQRPLTLMHCVAEYPTPDDRLQLNQIALLRQRYALHEVGYSTHERPDQVDSIKVAVGLGATLFEKHVGVPTETIRLNAYSATPAQVRAWLESARQACAMCGAAGARHEFSEGERHDLQSLRRGVFVRKAVRAGAHIDPANVLLAIPTVPGQITANDLSKYTDFIAQKDIPAGQAVLGEDTRRVDKREAVHAIIEQTRKFFKKTRLPLPRKVDLEVSHHFGIENFGKTGALLLNYINREYCKKVIVLFPGQSHPAHYHRLKEETFHVQYGTMKLDLDGEEREYRAGDIILVPRGAHHSFSTKTGVVFEEVSSTHFPNDSYYLDDRITANANRKTLLTYWVE